MPNYLCEACLVPCVSCIQCVVPKNIHTLPKDFFGLNPPPPPPPPWNFQFCFILSFKNFGHWDPCSGQNFQWLSLGWVLIFSRAAQYCWVQWWIQLNHEIPFRFKRNTHINYMYLLTLINSHSKDHLKSSCWRLGTVPSPLRVCFIWDNRSVITSLNCGEYSPITFGFSIFMFKMRRTLNHSSPCLHLSK